MAGCRGRVQLQESQRMAEEKRAVMVSIPGPGLLELCSASSYSQNINTPGPANIEENIFKHI